jgi:predicted permease
MAWPNRLVNGFRALFQKSRVEQELDAELREFLATSVDQKVKAGMTREMALRATRLEVGSVEALKDRVRDVGWETRLEACWQDLRHALRSLRKAPGFSAIAVLTLALGIGATTAIFSVVNGILLKPLPFPDADRLVGVWSSAASLNIKDVEMSASLYFTYREDNRTFEDIGLWREASYSVTGAGSPEQVEGLAVTDGTLPLLRVQPILGRRFTAKDDSPGSPETAMLTFRYWQSRFGGDPSVVGRRIVVNGVPRDVIGVLPRTFRFLNQQPALLLPFRFDRGRLRLGQFNYRGVARLKPGVTIAEANADTARMLSTYTSRWPTPPGMSAKYFDDAHLAANIRPLKHDAIADVGKVLWVIMGTIGIVLLIACANVANLMLVRAEGRHQELAVRAALGAGRMRLARGLLFESCVLAFGGGVVGLGVASAALSVLAAVAPAHLPRQGEISIDPTVLLFTMAISLSAGLLFGVVPMLRFTGARGDRVPALAGRSVSSSPERQRARNILVVAQVGLALVLLISSGLMIRTFQAMRRVDPGFTRPGDVWTLRVFIPQAQVREPERVVRMQHDILEKISEVSLVSSTAFATTVPMDGNYSGDPIFVEDRPYGEEKLAPIRRYKFASPGFFRTIGNPILAGRDFTWTDVYEKRPVAVVSASVARELWREPSAAIGRRIRDSLKGPWREIVGVVGDIRDDGVHRKASSAVYWPVLADQFWGQPTFADRSVVYVIRTQRTDDETLLKEIQQAVWAVNSNLPLADVRTLAEIYNRSMAQTSFAMVMLAIAGALALFLGLVGIYSVISYAVVQRTREIGIRVALGAQQKTVRRMFVRHALRLAVLGVVAGAAAALALMRGMSSLLFEVRPADPLTYGAVSVGLLAAVVVASYLPARCATKVNPLVALRSE